MINLQDKFKQLRKMSDEFADKHKALTQEIFLLEKQIAELELPSELMVKLNHSTSLFWSDKDQSFVVYQGANKLGLLMQADFESKKAVIEMMPEIIAAITRVYDNSLSKIKDSENVETTTKSRPAINGSKQEDRNESDGVIQKPNSVSPTKAPKRRKANKNRANRTKQDTKANEV